MRKLLFYPYPLDSLYCKPDSSFAISLIDDENSQNHETEKGFSFAVNIPPYSVRSYKLGYQQKVKGNYAEYILTSTQSWGEVFEQASYYFVTNEETIIDSFSFSPDSSYIENGLKNIFGIKRTFFLIETLRCGLKEINQRLTFLSSPSA